MDYESFLKDVKAKLAVFDYSGSTMLCEELVSHLFAEQKNYDTKISEKLMQQLRNKRQFHSMQKVGDALIQTQRSSPKIKRQFAQSLIDQGNFTSALFVLENLLAELEPLPEKDNLVWGEIAETKGLLGRTFKQLYVNSNNPKNEQNVEFLKKAIAFYYDVYQNSPNERTWHGINVVALLNRASEDDITISDYPSKEALAENILKVIEGKQEDEKADAWDFATAAEACIALDRPKEALVWLSGYAGHPFCDAFELGSTLRQLEEVWLLNINSEMGGALLTQLKAELVKRQGGSLNIGKSEFHQSVNTQEFITKTHQDTSHNHKTDPNSEGLEKVFSDSSFATHRWFCKGLSKCLSVARIGIHGDKGIGTGFLLPGEALHKSLGEELVLITNAHVISDPPERNALRPSEAVIIFEIIDRDEEFAGVEQIWSSPSTALDATIVRFVKVDQDRLKKLTKDIDFYFVSNYLPEVDPYYSQRIYIIGHPHGGTLQLSFHDNTLLDHEDPKIHYRTPTEGGSSGSPVFNDKWDLIGIHHAGNRNMRCLNDKDGFYEANEGIWIQSIIKQLDKDLNK